MGQNQVQVQQQVMLTKLVSPSTRTGILPKGLIYTRRNPRLSGKPCNGQQAYTVYLLPSAEQASSFGMKVKASGPCSVYTQHTCLRARPMSSTLQRQKSEQTPDNSG